MDAIPIVISTVAVLISAWTLWRQIDRDRWEKERLRWEQERHVEVKGRSLVVALPSGEALQVIGMRVANLNPRYAIHPHTIAFTPRDDSEPPRWFGGSPPKLPEAIEPNSAELIDMELERASEVFDEHFESTFVAWIELKTGEKFHSAPTRVPGSSEKSREQV